VDGVPVVVVAVASAFKAVCADTVATDAVADWLAASAAAAIASGPPAVPDAEVDVAGVAVVATVTGIATATGGGTRIAAPLCWVGSAEVVLEEGVVEPSPDAEAVDDAEEVEPSSLDEDDLLRERCGAPVLLVLPASEDDAGGGP
jgi:hypothetical protein